MNEKSKYRFETARENDDFRGGDPKNLRTGAGGGRVLGAAKGEPSPSTPSGAVAPYLKAEAKKRKRKTGREVGHEGAHRVSPEPDEVVELGLECCPECGGPVSKCRGKSTLKHRIIEDIPEDTKVKTTQYDVPTFWCPNCKKAVSPKVPDALPNATIGNRLAILTAWLHYANGNSIGQILDIFNFHMAVKLTSGGLVGIWTRLAEILRPWYDEIREKCLQSAVLHGDESGWRVNGETHWLWCFSTHTETYYFIDKSRGKPALHEFFKEFYDGVLVTDFWGPYDSIPSGGRQKYLVHLFREFKKVEKYRDSSDDWPAFSKKLKRLIRDAIRLWRDRRPDLPPETPQPDRRSRRRPSTVRSVRKTAAIGVGYFKGVRYYYYLRGRCFQLGILVSWVCQSMYSAVCFTINTFQSISQPGSFVAEVSSLKGRMKRRLSGVACAAGGGGATAAFVVVFRSPDRPHVFLAEKVRGRKSVGVQKCEIV